MATAHRRPSLTPSTPWRFSTPAENPTSRPQAGLTAAWLKRKKKHILFNI